MNKSLIFGLFATCTLSSVAMAALTEAEIADLKDTTKGNWTIALDLDTDAISKLINKEAGLNTYQGVNLVSWNGNAKYGHNGSSEGDNNMVENRHASYWLGWGNGYFNQGFMDQATGMDAGLQMGFASGNDAAIGNKPDLNSEYRVIGYTNAGYYRAHTKLDGNNSGVIDGAENQEENIGITMDALANFTSIDSATLTLVHNNSHYDPYSHTEGALWWKETVIDAPHSQTMQYLTITGTFEIDGKIYENYTLTFIAEVDDDGSISPDSSLSEGYPSSNRYDVDILEGVVFNEEYVDGYKIYWDTALTPDQVKNFDHSLFIGIPEPASATLSLISLAALCARRRRRK